MNEWMEAIKHLISLITWGDVITIALLSVSWLPIYYLAEYVIDPSTKWLIKKLRKNGK